MTRVLLVGCLFVFFSPAKALSGDFIGNGGHLVTCPDQPPKLMDFYEAEQLGQEVNLGGDELSINEKVSLILERLRRVDPLRADYFAQLHEDVSSNFLLRDGIEATDDYGETNVREPCVIEQFANQYLPRFPGDIVFTFERAFWESDEISKDHKAGLLLHEYVVHSH